MAKSLRKRFAVMAAVLIAALALPVIGSGTVHAAGGSYSTVVKALNKYGKPRNSIKGDLLIKKTRKADAQVDPKEDQSVYNYNTENDKVYQMKEGQEYTLGLKLNVTGIKQDMENVKRESGFTGNDPSSVTGDAVLDRVVIVHPESQMVANIKIPKGIDMTEAKKYLANLQLGDNFGEYKDNESLRDVKIPSTDPVDYDLTGYKFKVTSATYDDASRNLHIVMTLQMPKNFRGGTYDDDRQFNFGCLYSIVNGMPDNFTLEIPGIKLDKDVKADTDMTFDGSMGQNSDSSDCYMKANVTNHDWLWDLLGLKFRGNWFASQFAGGEDAAKPTTSAQGISLTVKKFVPKPEQPVTPKQVIQKGIKTGDTTPIALYVILAAAAAGVAVVLIKHRPARH